MKLFLILGSLNMIFAILLGAFGAHGLSSKVTAKMLQNWQTGALYHMIHALSLLVIGLLMKNFPTYYSILSLSGWFILLGILLFSGSLYALVLSDLRMWGTVTPIGGIFFLLGWAVVCFFAIKNILQ